jgi:hypothetical protein
VPFVSWRRKISTIFSFVFSIVYFFTVDSLVKKKKEKKEKDSSLNLVGHFFVYLADEKQHYFLREMRNIIFMGEIANLSTLVNQIIHVS